MQDIRERIKQDLRLSEHRLMHTYGVVTASLELANAHFAFLDPIAVETAALLHDMTKEYTPKQHEEVCKRYGDSLSKAEYASPQLMHAHTAALLAKNVYHTDDEITHAIAVHTTGCADMSPLDIVIYLGDYIEPNRTGEYCRAVKSTYEQNGGKNSTLALYIALLQSFDKTLSHLLQSGLPISENSIAARNYILTCLSGLDGQNIKENQT